MPLAPFHAAAGGRGASSDAVPPSPKPTRVSTPPASFPAEQPLTPSHAAVGDRGEERVAADGTGVSRCIPALTPLAPAVPWPRVVSPSPHEQRGPPALEQPPLPSHAAAGEERVSLDGAGVPCPLAVSPLQEALALERGSADVGTPFTAVTVRSLDHSHAMDPHNLMDVDAPCTAVTALSLDRAHVMDAHNLREDRAPEPECGEVLGGNVVLGGRAVQDVTSRDLSLERAHVMDAHNLMEDGARVACGELLGRGGWQDGGGLFSVSGALS
ncbi:hypothetical protein T484DRAFT_1762426, partial [Baffinella frigidus]